MTADSYTIDQLFRLSDRIGDRLSNMELAGEESTNLYRAAEEDYRRVEQMIATKLRRKKS